MKRLSLALCLVLLCCGSALAGHPSIDPCFSCDPGVNINIGATAENITQVAAAAAVTVGESATAEAMNAAAVASLKVASLKVSSIDVDASAMRIGQTAVAAAVGKTAEAAATNAAAVSSIEVTGVTQIGLVQGDAYAGCVSQKAGAIALGANKAAATATNVAAAISVKLSN